MKRICYVECFAGASGDMLLAALLDLETDKNWFLSELSKLTSLRGDYNIEISQVIKNGISAKDVNVILAEHDHHHRGLNEIIEIINASEISQKAKDLSIKIFTVLGEAEAKVHGTTIDKIHFHEVGAIDSIIDIVGFAILFTKLEIDKVYVSPVNTGAGFVKAAHGVLPVPAPATLEILKNSKWPIKNDPKVDSELLTPTGAAILSTIKTEFSCYPSFNNIYSVSYGAGKKDFKDIANVIRLTIGESDLNHNNEDTVILEANIDDISPEYYDFVFKKLFNVGCYDVFLIPIIMKKNRPANILSVICSKKIKDIVEQIIFEETTTFGIRCSELSRSVLNRKFQEIEIENLGKVTIKIGINSSGQIISQKPEYSDCEKLAIKNNLPIKKVYEIINLKLNS